MRQISAKDLMLSQSLQWFARQALRHGAGCSVLVLRPAAAGLRHGPRAGGAKAGGDFVTLEALARRVRPLLRQSDHVALESGVGLGIVLHGANEQGARLVHGRIRQALAPQADAPGREAACAQLVIGLATAEPTAPVRVPAVARDLCALASVPDQALSFPLGMAMAHSVAPASVRPHRVSQRRRLGRHSRATHALIPVPPTPVEEELDHLRAQADALGVPYVKLPPHVPESLTPLLEPDLLREVGAAPIGRTRDTLTVAMGDPTDHAAIARLAAASGLVIFPVLASLDDLARIVDLTPQHPSLRGQGERRRRPDEPAHE
jgi:hypothetical protein